MYKHHRYPRIIIQHAVYLKLRFTLSYRDVEELMALRGVKVDHSTLQRWGSGRVATVERHEACN